MRRLIINADDLGLTAGVNRGIAAGLRAGAITSATLMAVAPAFLDAVCQVQTLLPPQQANPGLAPQQAKTGLVGDPGVAPAGESAGSPCQPGSVQGHISETLREPDPGRPPRTGSLSIGCHVVLVDGRPLLAPTSVPSLMAASSQEFRSSFGSFARSLLARQVQEDQIAAEAEEQMRRAQVAGIALSHVDTHKHLHLFPAVLRAVLQAARSCGVRAIRNPFAPVKPLGFAHLLRRPRLWRRYTEVAVLRGWSESFRRAVRAAGMVTTDGTFGILSTGALDLKLFRAIIGCIPPGTWEFCCHPGHNDDDLAKTRTRLRASREQELAVITSPEARDIMARNGIELISYWDLDS